MFERRWLLGRLVVAACSVWLGGVTVSIASAQAPASPKSPGTSGRLLTAKEGRAIVSVVREHEPPARGTQDCSHLVHEIYALAGFAYPYASSFDLYAGSGSFAGVKTPQPGDVIVWPGHAGIVFDPKHHLFYSLVSSGLDAADYQGPYWRSRGKPRFYRYVVGNRGTLLAAKTQPGARGSDGAERHNTTQVVEETSSVGDSSSKGSAKEASERSAVFDPAVPEAPTKAAGAPLSIVIADGRKQPTRDEVVQGILELSNAAGDVLRSSDPLRGGTPVIVFEQLSVDSVEIKRDRGWAFVQIDSRATIVGAETDLNRRSDKVRWELRRRKSGWEAVSPADRTYVPRDAAVRILAAQLAQLTQKDHGAEHPDTIRRQETQLVNLLDVLIENK
jgi:hypothetical protein